MKAILKTILYFLKDSINFILYITKTVISLISIFLQEKTIDRCKYRSKNNTKNLAVLANGPSLKSMLDNINEEVLNLYDFSVMNYFATDKRFKLIKPQYYCLADPMFFKKDNRYEKVMNLFSILNNEVDWKMTLFIPSYFNKNKFLKFSQLNNPYIKVKPVIAVQYTGFKCLEEYFYKKGLSCPIIGTVANLSVYTGINLGYKNIDLYGADMTFFDSLIINEKNQLCYKYAHFNEQNPQLTPVTQGDTNVMKMKDYILMVYNMYLGHSKLATYSNHLNVKIVNLSPNSMLDCYIRK